MNCKPTPEATCGSLIAETCVTIVDNTIFQGCPAWLDLDVDVNACYRQSDFNRVFASAICNAYTLIGQSGTCVAGVYTAGSGIYGAIYLGCLTKCDGVTPIPSSVRDAIAELYSEVCALKLGLDMSIGDVDPKCLVDPCGPPITTLGPLLQALVNAQCANGIYRATMTQTGITSPVVTELENTIGAIVWTRTGVGVYTATLAGAFPADKTFILISPGNDITEYIAVERTSANVITVKTYINAVAADVVLTESSIEIRVYP